jgi:predicted ester cyclase
VYDTFVRDESAFYDVVPFNIRYTGFSGVKDFYEAANASFPDFEITVWGEYDVPGCSIREVTISGTHEGNWCGIPGTGRHVRFQLAAFYVFGAGQQAGKLLAERIYFDNETIMRQLRGEIDEASIIDFPMPRVKPA